MPEELKPDSSGSAPDDGVTPDSPTDDQTTAEQGDSQAPKDVEASSSEKDQADKPSLLDEVEQAMVNESGKALEDKPEVKPKEEGESSDDTKRVEAEAKKDEKAEGEPETDEEKAKKLHEVPEGVKEGSKAHTRFQDLVANNKQAITERDEAVAQAQGMRDLITDSGVDKAGFTELLDYAREASKGDPRKALEMLDKQRKDLVLRIGEDIKPPEILSDFPELQTKVTDGELAVEDAVKLAKSQNLEAQNKADRERQEKEQESQQQYDQAVESNRNEAIALEKKWMAEDIDWGVKRELIQARVPEINKQPPSEWPRLFQEAYDLISETIKAAGGATKKLEPDNPVRKGGSDEKGKQEPKTLLEAVSLENNWG